MRLTKKEMEEDTVYTEIQERQNSCYLIVQSLFIPNGIDDIEKKMNSAMDFLS